MVKFGIDTFLKEDPNYKNKNLAIVTNNAAITSDGILTRIALINAGYNLKLIFSPEHGLNAKGEDGAFMANDTDLHTGLPIISLYGNHLKPTIADIRNIDLIIFDMPDVGVRFYTYLSTLTYILEFCSETKIPLILLDRPNPLSGNFNLVEGPMLDELNCSSFIGRWQIPLRHSCTFGELGQYFNETRNLRVSLRIFPCTSWNRSMYFKDWKTSFLPTSPAINSAETQYIYPGSALLEATNISEGRGTSTPFKTIGAPWLNGFQFSDNFLPVGIAFTPTKFVPAENKYKGEACYGWNLSITDLYKARTVITFLHFIKEIFDFYPNHFKWNIYPTRANPRGNEHLSLLLGILQSENTFTLPKPEFYKYWQNKVSVPEWELTMKNFLIYS